MNRSNSDEEKTEPNLSIPIELDTTLGLLEALESVLNQTLSNEESDLLLSVAARLIVLAQRVDDCALQKVSELVAVSTWRE